MSVLTGILICVIGFVFACLQKIVADDFKAWRPTLVARIIAAAVRNLPLAKRPRYSEEWNGHIDAMPGDLAKLGAAVGCLIASWTISGAPLRLRKRCVDVFVSATALAFLGPLLCLSAFLIKLNAPGPIFVRERRIGKNGQPFGSFVFRTRDSSGGRTAVGNILRGASLDALPQLFNVLAGQMSLVGPRTLTHENGEVDQAATADSTPGIVGLWAFGERENESSDYLSFKLQIKLLVAFLGLLIVIDGRPQLERSFKVGKLCIVLIIIFFALIALVGDKVIF